MEEIGGPKYTDSENGFSKTVTSHTSTICPAVLTELKKGVDAVTKIPVKKFEPVRGFQKIYGKLQETLPVVPSACNVTDETSYERSKLPIFKYRQTILHSISTNQVVIIIADTGSGKSSQVPQYIIENASGLYKACKIICTQPKRFAAVSLAERVTAERGDTLGGSVGYHVRLESKSGFSSNLIYCTVEVLLRNLMCGCENSFLKSITHVIVDEIHERDKHTDILLTVLRQNLHKNPSLKLILLSASKKSIKFQKYFGTGVVINIPSEGYPIKNFFLDEVLSMTQYCTAKIKSHIAKLKYNKADLPQSGIADMDTCLEMYSQMFGKVAISEDIRRYIWCFRISIDYQHSGTGMTCLMYASYLGDKQFADDLCKMGADLTLTCHLGHTAYDYAVAHNNSQVILLLYYYQNRDTIFYDADYQSLFELVMPEKNDFIDYNLIVAVITFIHRSQETGGIVVFLPGFDEITECYKRILNSPLDSNEYVIIFLYDTMYVKGQQELFKPTDGLRRIILSTNIAETYFTIEDIDFVIDTGKRLEKIYDPNTEKTVVRNNWATKACAKARERQAGKVKPGLCFKLYSSQRFRFMEEETLPEIMTCALEDLCLTVKNLMTRKTDIETFFTFTPDPPNVISIKKAVKNLQTLGALTANEEITPLGEYLSQLVIQPYLGKLLILGCIFKCIDPILTLAAVLAEKDSLFLPVQENNELVIANRKRLAENVLSDQLIYLKIFQTWQSDKLDNHPSTFCQQHGISESTMKIILDNRRQLLGQLRAAGFVNNMRCVEGFTLFAHDWGVVKAIMCNVFKGNLACPDSVGFTTESEKNAMIHKISVCKNSRNYLFYEQTERNSQGTFLKGVTVVSPLVIALMCGDFRPNSDSIVKIGNWLEIDLSNGTFSSFKNILDDIIKKSFQNPLSSFSDFNLEFLQHFRKIVQLEEADNGWRQPHLLGVRPSFLFNIEDNLTEQTKKDSSSPRFQYKYTGVETFNSFGNLTEYLETHRKGLTPKKFVPSVRNVQHSDTLRRQLPFSENSENVPPQTNLCQAFQGLQMLPNTPSTSMSNLPTTGSHYCPYTGRTRKSVLSTIPNGNNSYGDSSPLTSRMVALNMRHSGRERTATDEAGKEEQTSGVQGPNRSPSSTNFKNMFMDPMSTANRSETESDQISQIHPVTEHNGNTRNLQFSNINTENQGTQPWSTVAANPQQPSASQMPGHSKFFPVSSFAGVNATETSASSTTFDNQMWARNPAIFNGEQGNLPTTTRREWSPFAVNGQQQSFSLFSDCFRGSAATFPPSTLQRSVQSFTASTDNYKSNTLYILIKAAEKKNVDIGQNTHKWVFSPPTEKKIIALAQEGKEIYLIFYVKEFGYIGGVAKYVSMCYWNTYGKPTAMIQWIYTEPLQDLRVRHLSNASNGGRPIYEGLDGTIIDNDVAEELLRIYNESRQKN